VSALLAVLDDWTDADAFAAAPDGAGVLETLCENGLVEANR
jgi:hypothetical protein